MREAVDNFLNYLAVEKGFSPNTIAAYRNDLNQLVSFIGEEAAKRGSIPPGDCLACNRTVLLAQASGSGRFY